VPTDDYDQALAAVGKYDDGLRVYKWENFTEPLDGDATYMRTSAGKTEDPWPAAKPARGLLV
jgi:hypothetical protein